MTRIEELEAKYKLLEGNLEGLVNFTNHIATSLQEISNRVIFLLCDLGHSRPMWCEPCEAVVIQALDDGKPNDNNCPTCGEELQEPNKEEEE